MEDDLRHGPISALLAMLVIASSCSWYRGLERDLVADDQKKASKSRTVPREQYDQLLVKYEELAKRYESLKDDPNSKKDSLVDDLQRTQSENFSRSGQADTETVDLFAETTSPVKGVPKGIEDQLELYRRGLALKNSRPGDATKTFQQLENHSIPAVQVRAKLQIGDMLFKKQQYDLALQVFEDVINNHAHSGAVLEALKYAAICSEKLGIMKKKEQYASMLNDVFEAK